MAVLKSLNRIIISLNGAKLKKKVKTTITPSVTAPITSNPTLLDVITEQGTNQLKIYMHSQKFERPNVLGFCLVYVGNDCEKIVAYPVN